MCFYWLLTFIISDYIYPTDKTTMDHIEIGQGKESFFLDHNSEIPYIGEKESEIKYIFQCETAIILYLEKTFKF